MVIRIDERWQLRELAHVLRVLPDWHEPENQGVTARVLGDDFDNCGFWGHNHEGKLFTYGEGRQELWVEVSKDGEPVAEINLATLLAIASEA